ncbi:4-alpha-glucanotransferase [Breznakiellaceae bacterium SP9]
MATRKRKAVRDRLIGTVVPVGALRGADSIGVGEFPDLIEFAELCTKVGIGLVQILPVNDTGYESSPYSALSAFALHPLYLRIGDLPEANTAATKEKLAALKKQFDGQTRFPYYQLMQAKMQLLREIYDASQREITGPKETGILAKWIEKNQWVKAYAVYRHLKEANDEKSWKDWTTHKRVTPAEIETLFNDVGLRHSHLFWAWLQLSLDKQFKDAASAVSAKGILLEGDLPILINEDSADVWAHPEYFNQDLSAGAPPDMYSPEGQNWGFPIYDWKAQGRDDFKWWKERLSVAGQYYGAYRIDHVLGFFRIWASPRSDYSAALGRYVPYIPIKTTDLQDIGFDQGRINWFSRPHVPTGELWDALRNNWGGPHSEADVAGAAEQAFSMALERIGQEELWLFKNTIKGERDIAALGLHIAAQAYLIKAWSNRLFLEYEKNSFFPVWYGRNSRAYNSLSQEEKQRIEGLLESRRLESEAQWEKEGKRLLSLLGKSSPMQACAEDLGAVPDCVPRVLTALKILGLRVVRWTKHYDRSGEPYVSFAEYPQLSVCTTSVHDSSTLRDWWDHEANQNEFASFINVPSLPKVYNPGTAKKIIHETAGAASKYRVFPIQDLLHLSPKWYAKDDNTERINIPGSSNEFNWTYRLPAPIAEIGQDTDLLHALEELTALDDPKSISAAGKGKSAAKGNK